MDIENQSRGQKITTITKKGKMCRINTKRRTSEQAR